MHDSPGSVLTQSWWRGHVHAQGQGEGCPVPRREAGTRPPPAEVCLHSTSTWGAASPSAVAAPWSPADPRSSGTCGPRARHSDSWWGTPGALLRWSTLGAPVSLRDNWEYDRLLGARLSLVTAPRGLLPDAYARFNYIFIVVLRVPLHTSFMNMWSHPLATLHFS